MAFFTRKKSAPFSDVREMVAASRTPDRKERKFIENRLRVPLSKLKDHTSYLEVGSQKVWASFRACHITANVLLGTNFKVTSTREAGGEQIEEEIDNDELNWLLSHPNDFDTMEDMLYQWVFHMKLCGVAYWLKDEMVGGRPTKLWPLLPQYMKIVPHPTDKVEKYVYSVNGQELDFQPEEILHFRRPHPADVNHGLGDIEPAEALYNDFINRDTLEEKFLENGAMPSGMLFKKGEPINNPDTWEEVKSWWRKEYEGKKNAGKTAIMSSEWDYKKLGLTSAEMQSIEREKLTIEQIFINHGVPLSVAGFTNAANYATARQDEINFRRMEVVPLLNQFSSKMNHPNGGVIPMFNEAWELGYELSGLIDVEQVWRDYGDAFNRGVLTPNEMRELMGLGKVEDLYMDTHYVPRTHVPMEMAGEADPEQQTIDRLTQQRDDQDRQDRLDDDIQPTNQRERVETE